LKSFQDWNNGLQGWQATFAGWADRKEKAEQRRQLRLYSNLHFKKVGFRFRFRFGLGFGKIRVSFSFRFLLDTVLFVFNAVM
jgi:hypothetical protein